MPTSQKTQQICALFQRALKNGDYAEVNKLRLEELQSADIDLGSLDLNSPYRLALKYKIEEKISTDVNSVAKKRHQQIIWISVASIVVTVIIAVISWKRYFS